MSIPAIQADTAHPAIQAEANRINWMDWMADAQQPAPAHQPALLVCGGTRCTPHTSNTGEHITNESESKGACDETNP